MTVSQASSHVRPAPPTCRSALASRPRPATVLRPTRNDCGAIVPPRRRPNWAFFGAPFGSRQPRPSAAVATASLVPVVVADVADVAPGDAVGAVNVRHRQSSSAKCPGFSCVGAVDGSSEVWGRRTNRSVAASPPETAVIPSSARTPARRRLAHLVPLVF